MTTKHCTFVLLGILAVLSSPHNAGAFGPCSPLHFQHNPAISLFSLEGLRVCSSRLSSHRNAGVAVAQGRTRRLRTFVRSNEAALLSVIDVSGEAALRKFQSSYKKGFATVNESSGHRARTRARQAMRLAVQTPENEVPAAAPEVNDEEVPLFPLLRNQIKGMSRLKKQSRIESWGVVHPAEKGASTARGGGFGSKTHRRRTGSATTHRGSATFTPSQQAQTDWFRAKTEELAILRDNTEPFRPGQLVYCANDDGRLVRGTILSIDRAKNRLLVGRVRLHAGTNILQAGDTKIKTFRLPALFPIGGCNGGLESELEKFVNFNAHHDLHGAAAYSGGWVGSCSDEEAYAEGGQYETGSSISWLTAGRAPAVDDVLTYLEEQKLRIMHMPFREHTLHFTSRQLCLAREGLKHALVDAETRLLRFCEVLASSLFGSCDGSDGGGFSRSTGVTCELALFDGKREPFTVEEPLSDETLLSLMSGEGFGKQV